MGGAAYGNLSSITSDQNMSGVYSEFSHRFLDFVDALTYINLLYREKAKIETDEAKKTEDVAQADKYREQALELRKKSLATTPTPEPGK